MPAQQLPTEKKRSLQCLETRKNYLNARKIHLRFGLAQFHTNISSTTCFKCNSFLNRLQLFDYQSCRGIDCTQ